MAETYCGKSCADCIHKEQLACPGCKTGPGQAYRGDCAIATCCRQKGHLDGCDTCSFCNSCHTLRGKTSAPENRLKALAAEEARVAALARSAPVLAVWLWVLFWLIIPDVIASIMTNQTLSALIPNIALPGQLLTTASTVVHGLILIRLSTENRYYLSAGVYVLIAGVADFLAVVLVPPAWSALLTVPAAILALIATYKEFNAHSHALAGLNEELSAKWSVLWKWYIGMLCVVFAATLIAMLFPVLGALALLPASIALFVIGILQMVYLYKTAKTFRDLVA